MNVINLKPEGVELLNDLCKPSSLEEKITVLDSAEEKLQELACSEFSNAQQGYNLYDLAYTIKGYKKDLMKLKGLLEDGEEQE
jgi:hypothetical protein